MHRTQYAACKTLQRPLFPGLLRVLPGLGLWLAFSAPAVLSQEEIPHIPQECPFEGTSESAALAFLFEFREIDGTGNNLTHDEWGAADTPLLRLTSIGYADGISEPAGPDRPSVRIASNHLCRQSGSILNSLDASDYLWQFGQFHDHDVDLTDMGGEAFNILVPRWDEYFDPDGTGVEIIPLNRSIFEPHSSEEPRQQLNGITSYIDASNVYGSDECRAWALRTNDGTGMLRTSAGNLLPFNYQPPWPGSDPCPCCDADGYVINAAPPGAPQWEFFLAGDIRVNEQVALTAMHTLFVREHNWLAAMIRHHYRGLNGEQIYQFARAIVGAEMQVVTYREFLPELLGPTTLGLDVVYDSYVNAGVSNFFSTAAFRLGHSMLDPSLRLDDLISITKLPLREAFFNPKFVVNEGIDPLLRGLAGQRMQTVDALVVDEVRNFLFGEPPGAVGFDLTALNMQRGRDHGMPDYNLARVDWGLFAVTQFDQISSDPAIQAQLEAVYGTVDHIDSWIGGLTEDAVPPGHVGTLIRTVMFDHFSRVSVGDRFWYERHFAPLPRILVWLENNKLARVVRRNTDIGPELPADVFNVQ